MTKKSIPPILCAAAAAASIAFGLLGIDEAEAEGQSCPEGMVSIRDKYCIDQYEASTVEILDAGMTRAHAYFLPVDGLKVKAVSAKGVMPQAHISRDQAEKACKSAGKRLCTDVEWIEACRGTNSTRYPYGSARQDGYCNDHGVSAFRHYYGAGAEPSKEMYTFANMNDPRLNQLKGALAPTGAFTKCHNEFNVFDMVGNLHEWTAAKRGTFRGGYYLDAHLNGEGCDYRTTAHTPNYYDYSSGFRCCM
jgi:formylglycine-generating enzyme required for sulfatase activity